MSKILLDFEVNPTTWVYIASLMMIGIFFKFRRLWSVRNLDLALLILYAPGLLMLVRVMAEESRLDPERMEHLARLGYVWLFAVGGCVLFRLLLDPMMVRRPLLEPNLSAGGLSFAGLSLLVFLMANVVTQDMRQSEVTGGPQAEYLILHGQLPADVDLGKYGPGFPLFQIFAGFSEQPAKNATPPEQYARAMIRRATTRTTAILAHLAVVVGLVLIGYRHFDNLHTGVAMATLYLLLPYTSQTTPQVEHVIPAAALVWAVEAYRRPVVAGIFVGLAAARVFFPLFLLPLWCGFYARRGLVRFLLSVLAVLLVMAASLLLISSGPDWFWIQLRHMFGLDSLSARNLAGFWQFQPYAFYRIPVFVAFVVLCGSLGLWPPQKNYGTLLSCSAAVMLGTQFWCVPNGGIYLNWYLPLLILTIFRPNLEDRVATTAVTEAWKRRPKPGLNDPGPAGRQS